MIDTSVDAAIVSLKLGKFFSEASVSREKLFDLDILARDPRDRINNYILTVDYNGFEDIKLNGYAVLRDDRDNEIGQPLLVGARSLGLLNRLSYWVEAAHLRGSDELSQDLKGFAFDVGATYRLDLPGNPNITLGYAYATGDRETGDNKNHQFRQTGLQSNELRFAGVTEFKRYGEALDPELSNLRILTAGVGFRPSRRFSIDLLFHHFRQQAVSEELRGTSIEAELNQDATELTRDLGSEIDLVLGFRNLFGVRRLGMDIRLGWFRPGRAFRRDIGDDVFRDADNAFVANIKFWW